MSQETTAVTNSAIRTKRARISTSNIFARFERVKIQEFKVAFDLIDRNRDGFIDKKDLHDMLISLGRLVGTYNYYTILYGIILV